MLVAPKVFVPPPETETMALVPVSLKVAPFETVKFFALASVMANPPLPNVPVPTVRSPVTFDEVMLPSSVAPLALVLSRLRLL